ncbi:MAG: sigma-70 family RNA polymerase sigma factor [Gemmataceae bacterium]|nr:sigma-70 family RNA polymerase sigma factor [Gemmataceae bacterium]
MHDAPPDPRPDDDHDLTTFLRKVAGGDTAARDELFARAQARLEQLAHRMLRRNPAVARWADTGDVLQNASLRLLRALEKHPVADTRGFFNLSAHVIRLELIDLARHFHGPEGVGRHHDSLPPRADGPQAPDTPAGEPDVAELDRWAALHKAVEDLPAEDREVFGLTFYHKWSQEQIAELFGVDERTVRRRFRRAAEALNRALGGQFPGG